MTDIEGSYVQVADADEYFATRTPSSEWDALEDSEKAVALQTATKHIDRMPLRGTRYEAEYIEDGEQTDYDDDGLIQTLEFPRVIDGITCDWDYGTELPIVPQRVKDACCEEALAIVKWGNSSRLALRQQGVTQMQLGAGSGLSESYSGRGRGLLSSEAIEIMRRYVGIVDVVV
jgi:hypothetical protein